MLDIRPTQPADLPSLDALFADRFGHGLTPADWTWKYRQIPGAGRSLVAVEGGRVLAHAGALRLPARWKGLEGGIWQMVDFAGTTRRRGLRAAMVELGGALMDPLPGAGDQPWIFGFPSERHERLGERALHYRPLQPIEPLSGELPAGSSDARMETGDSCGDWAEAVWEACGGLGMRRSAAFLNWRYYARPRRYYRFYRLSAGGCEGFAVFSFVAEEAWAAEVWLPPEGRWYPSLVAVAADLRAAGLRRWRFWPGPGLDPRLVGPLGLRPTGELQLIGSRGRLHSGVDHVAAAAGFPYAMGDYDLV